MSAATCSPGERAHDATVADAYRLIAKNGHDARARLWRSYVLSTREERIARIDAPSFEWPAMPPPKVCRCGDVECDGFHVLGGE